MTVSVKWVFTFVQLFQGWKHFLNLVLSLSSVLMRFCLRSGEAFRSPSNRNRPTAGDGVQRRSGSPAHVQTACSVSSPDGMQLLKALRTASKQKGVRMIFKSHARYQDLHVLMHVRSTHVQICC
jgi:hypothetical protein